jgi:NADPH:quinone reductase-like Zn-dependent oxidoreductase
VKTNSPERLQRQLSGFQVITTASSKNAELLKSLGAKHVVDYSSPAVFEDISRLTGGRVEYIFDCVSADNSTQTAIKALPGAGGKVVVLLPTDPATLDKKVDLRAVFLYKIAGKDMPFPDRTVPASPEDKVWAENMCGTLSKLNLQGKLKGNPVKLMGGLGYVAERYKYMKDGNVHAQKLVYEVIKE